MVAVARTMPQVEHRFKQTMDLTIESKQEPTPKPVRTRSFPIWLLIGSSLAAFCAGMLMQILITVKKPDGTEASVVIPDGSTAVVDAQGNVTVRLANGREGVIPHSRVTRAPGTVSEADTGDRDDWATVSDESDWTRAMVPASESLWAIGSPAGHLVDVVTNPVFRDGKFVPSQIIVGQVRYDGKFGIRQKDGKKIAMLPMSLESRDQIQRAVESGYEVVCQFHRKENRLKNDRYLLQGVWGGRLPNDVPFALTFHNDRVIFFAPGGYQKTARFDVEQNRDGGKSRLLRVIGSDNSLALSRELDRGEYWFGQSGTLRPDRLFVTSRSLPGVITELQRVKVTRNEVELDAAKFRERLMNEPIRFSVHIAEPQNQNDGAKDDLESLVYEPEPIITNRDFVSARVGGEQPTLYARLSEFAGEKMHYVTSSRVGSMLVVKLDGKVVIAPKISSPVGRNMAVSGDFQLEQLQEIARDMVPMSRQDRRALSEEKLRQLMLGILNYESVHREFPSAHHRVKGSKNPFSWRVAILPYIEQEELYRKFRFDEPWDSKHNLAVARQMPDVFRLPGDDQNSSRTHYLAVAGKRTVLATDRPVGLESVTDGTSNTIALIQDEKRVIWTQPLDFSVTDDSIADLANRSDPLFTFVRCDAEVVTVERSGLNEHDLKSAILRDDNVVPSEQLLSNPENPFRTSSRSMYVDPDSRRKEHSGSNSVEAPELSQEPGVIQEGLPLATPKSIKLSPPGGR